MISLRKINYKLEILFIKNMFHFWLIAQVTNPTYVFICFGAAVEALIIGGMATFGAKLIQEKFNVDITYAGTIMGML